MVHALNMGTVEEPESVVGTRRVGAGRIVRTDQSDNPQQKRIVRMGNRRWCKVLKRKCLEVGMEFRVQKIFYATASVADC